MPYKTRAIIPLNVRFERYLPADRDPEACWEWTGSRNEHGYGKINRGRAGEGIARAHRLSYELHHGVTLTSDQHVCHKCDNPPCVNPAHLFLGDMATNLQDAAAKGRTGPQTGKTGEKTRKLTDAHVVAIREACAAGGDHDAIAAEYGIARGYVSILAYGGARAAAGGPLTRRRVANYQGTDRFAAYRERQRAKRK